MLDAHLQAMFHTDLKSRGVIEVLAHSRHDVCCSVVIAAHWQHRQWHSSLAVYFVRDLAC